MHITRGWEWAVWKFREEIESLLGRRITDLGIYVGRIGKPKRITTKSGQSITFSLTDEILRAIGNDESGTGKMLLGNNRKAIALSDLLGQIEAWEGSRTKEFLESGAKVKVWNLRDDSLPTTYLQELIESIVSDDDPLVYAVREIFDGSVFKNLPDLRESTLSVIRDNLQKCVLAIEALWQPGTSLIGSRVTDDRSELMIWVNLTALTEDIFRIKEVVATISERERGRFLQTTYESPQTVFARNLAKRHLRMKLERRLYSLDKKKLIESFAEFSKDYFYAEVVVNYANQHIVSSTLDPVLIIPITSESLGNLHVYKSTVGGYLDDSDFCESVKQAVSNALNRADAARTGKTRFDPPMISTNNDLHETIGRISLAADDELILITGEPGTGKGRLARFIHELSGRKGKFVTVTFGKESPELIWSELFGHEKGSFTGAFSQRKGAFEQARGGTLLIDDIGVLPYNLQPQLLHALQERTFNRMGSETIQFIDARIIVTTNECLWSRVKAGTFRNDLFSRIHRNSIHLPALRDRQNDLKQLVNYFIEYNCMINGQHLQTVSIEAWKLLSSYSWPGNVREFVAGIAQAVRNCDGSVLLPSHFRLGVEDPLTVIDSLEVPPKLEIPLPVPVREADNTEIMAPLDDMIVYRVWMALREAKGNQTEASRHLRISRQQIRRHIKEIETRIGSKLSEFVGPPPWPDSGDTGHRIERIGRLIAKKGAASENADVVDRIDGQVRSIGRRIISDRPSEESAPEIVKALLSEVAWHNELLNNIDHMDTRRTLYYGQRLEIRSGNKRIGITSQPIEFCNVPEFGPEQCIFLKSMGCDVPTRIPSFRIAKYPITVRDYIQFINDTTHPPPQSWTDGIPPRSGRDFPMGGLVWGDVQAYCAWLSEILKREVGVPSDAQWLAAAGVCNDGRRFPWGNQWQIGACNSEENGEKHLTSVRAFANWNVSPFGCVDMLGNVWEWTSTLGTQQGFPWRVARGGSYRVAVLDQGLATRSLCRPGHFIPVLDLGLRVVDRSHN